MLWVEQCQNLLAQPQKMWITWGIITQLQLFNHHNSMLIIRFTFGSATLCLSGFLISYLIVDTPKARF